MSLTSPGGENGVIYGAQEGICVDNNRGVTTGCNTGDGGMQWIPLSNGTYYNPRSGKCLYDSGGTTNSTQLEIDTCNAASRTELWNVPHTVPSGTGEITSDLGSSYCVDDTNASKTSGNPLQIYTCNGEVQQSWNPPNF